MQSRKAHICHHPAHIYAKYAKPIFPKQMSSTDDKVLWQKVTGFTSFPLQKKTSCKIWLPVNGLIRKPGEQSHVLRDWLVFPYLSYVVARSAWITMLLRVSIAQLACQDAISKGKPEANLAKKVTVVGFEPAQTRSISCFAWSSQKQLDMKSIAYFRQQQNFPWSYCFNQCRVNHMNCYHVSSMGTVFEKTSIIINRRIVHGIWIWTIIPVNVI